MQPQWYLDWQSECPDHRFFLARSIFVLFCVASQTLSCELEVRHDSSELNVMPSHVGKERRSRGLGVRPQERALRCSRSFFSLPPQIKCEPDCWFAFIFDSVFSFRCFKKGTLCFDSRCLRTIGDGHTHSIRSLSLVSLICPNPKRVILLLQWSAVRKTIRGRKTLSMTCPPS